MLFVGKLAWCPYLGQVPIDSGTPFRVSTFIGYGGSNVLDESLIADPEFLEACLRLDERESIRAATKNRIKQLHGIILPETHFADLIGSGKVVEGSIPATGAGEASIVHGHSDDISMPP